MKGLEGEILKKARALVSGCNDGDVQEFVVACNLLLSRIDEETARIHNLIRDNYRSRFPELESLIDHPMDYARVVRKMGNESDATLVDLGDLLPSAMIMVVCVASSSSTGKPLTNDLLEETARACDAALALDSVKNELVDLLGSRMVSIAPNLSAVVGSTVAAKLMGMAGSLSVLAQTPADCVQFFGSNGGFVKETEIIESTPPRWRRRAVRLVGGRLILAARVDYVRGDPTGETGRSFRAEVEKRIEKWQEAPPPRKVLAKPILMDMKPNKRKRGGRRARKSKERYGLTKMRKLENRMLFGVAEESSLGDGYGRGFGLMLHRFNTASNSNLAFTSLSLCLANPQTPTQSTTTTDLWSKF